MKAKTEPLYSFDINNHSKPVYDYCLSKAKEDKLWAANKLKELNGREWSEASEVSKQMLNEYSTETQETLAIKRYKYLRLRSHSLVGSSSYLPKGYPIDKPAFELWTTLTGEEPKSSTT